MSRYLMSTNLAAVAAVLLASNADAQFKRYTGRPSGSPSVSMPESVIPEQPSRDSTTSTDVARFTPDAVQARQMAALLKGMDQLIRENQELKAKLDETKVTVDRIEGRAVAHSKSTSIASTGETLISLIEQIRNRVNEC